MYSFHLNICQKTYIGVTEVLRYEKIINREFPAEFLALVCLRSESLTLTSWW